MSSTRTPGNLTLVIESSKPLKNIWYPGCSTAAVLRKKSAQGWLELRDDRPKEGSGHSYYLDDAWVENCSLGCDGGFACSELPLHAELKISTLEYIQVGSKTPSEPTSACNDGSPAPSLVSRDTEGPYQFELQYVLDACPSDTHESMLWEIPGT